MKSYIDLKMVVNVCHSCVLVCAAIYHERIPLPTSCLHRSNRAHHHHHRFLFLKKNADPDWQVTAGGVTFGPSQRWLVMFSVTSLVVVFWCGSAVISNALWFLMFLCLHGFFHQIDDAAMAEELAGAQTIAKQGVV